MGRPRIKPTPDDIRGAVGERIRELRESRGLTQRELAKAGAISAVFLGTVERGEKAATIESVDKIARGLRVEVLELFRFGSKAPVTGLAERLGRKIAAMAEGASESDAARFERIARAFFEADRTAKDRRTGPKRPSRRGRGSGVH